MGRIAVLDRQTVDKIAAGEVVERPSAVVKELVENAVDAGASQITVELKEGGIGFIRITDNGCGMEEEDIPLAFLRHSTSKIRNAADLASVSSLGFRGEALSSICAVSMVELITKTKDSVAGSRCCLEGGVQKSLEETGASDGTTLIVRNLFYNTPARKKFLRTEASEAAAAHELLVRLALSHPEISFRMLINGQMKLQTAGNKSLKDVIYHVYGRDVAMRLLPLDMEKGRLRVTGFIGKPEISRGNRNYENYFINGRYVKDKFIAKGIEDGYKSFMMQHRYPFVCLHIQMDASMLDVNVHPSKMEVRFSDQNLVYDSIRQMIKETLSGKELIPEMTLPDKAHPLDERREAPGPVQEPAVPQDKNLDYFMKQMRARVEERHRKGQPVLREENGYKTFPAPPQEKPCNKAADGQLCLFDGKLLSQEAAVRHEILGQLFGTYWLVQYADKLYIIDQHAAHEKVLYERLVKNIKERTVQPQLLSPPLVLHVNMQEEQLYLMYRQYFADMGFQIEEFGEGTYAVRAVPSELPGLARQEILTELLDSLSELAGSVRSESLLDKLASMSCKAAVKGNHTMSSAEAKALVDELLALENPYNCPHGRPTILSMSRHELEKKFKRTV